MTILDEIFAAKRREVATRQALEPLAAVQARAARAVPPRDFVAGLRARSARGERPALIAEIKRASPSRGLLVRDFDPCRLARTYVDNGAAAISVLTDEPYFGGSLEHLRAVAEMAPRVPLLRKDFLCDPYQVYEARAAGADAVLLIVAMLSPAHLAELHALALSLGMAPLVEVHSAPELETALRCAPVLIGINNRDLRDFTVHLDTTLQLRPAVPPNVLVVAESGIHTPEDVRRLADAGVDAILVGESLVTAPDIAAQVRRLAGHGGQPQGMAPAPRAPALERRGVSVKICGVTTLDDALAAADSGADMLGFNFYAPSPRYVAAAECARISVVLRSRYPALRLVGVFVNAPLSTVLGTLDECGLDLAQLHGDEPPEMLAALGARGFKAFRPQSVAEAERDLRRYSVTGRLPAPGCLLDAARPGQYGGTGQVADWGLARTIAERCPVLLAGGLAPENVAAAVKAVRPWGVDVASGVEQRPGYKDYARMAAFVAAVRGSAENGDQ